MQRARTGGDHEASPTNSERMQIERIFIDTREVEKSVLFEERGHAGMTNAHHWASKFVN